MKRRKQPKVTVHVLRQITKAVIPFYRKIMANRSYALRWTRAVRTANITKMEKLSQPYVTRNPGIDANGIGYFFDFQYPKPIYVYLNGTSLLPGKTQFYFNTAAHRSIAKSVLPLYRKIADDPVFAGRIVCAVRKKNTSLLKRLIKRYVTTRYLHSVHISSSGFLIGFKFPFSPYVFYNQFFQWNIH